MKLMAEFDPDFAARPRPKCRRIRFWRLVILCARGRARGGTRRRESSTWLADDCAGPRPRTSAP